MGQARRRGTRDQRVAEAQQKADQLAVEIEFPQMFFGYNRERHPGEMPFDIPDDMVCMVSNITAMNQADINAHLSNSFEIGQWFVSTGRHSDTVVNGPFSSMDDAFEMARSTLGVTRFISGNP